MLSNAWRRWVATLLVGGVLTGLVALAGCSGPSESAEAGKNDTPEQAQQRKEKSGD